MGDLPSDEALHHRRDDAPGLPDEFGQAESPDRDTDWRAELPDDLKRFAANLATPLDAVRMAAGLRQKLSRAIFPPEAGATDEEVADFHRRIGVPETPEGYAIQHPADVGPLLAADPRHEADERAFLDAMHEAGAPQAAVETAVDWYYGRLADQLAASVRQREFETRRARQDLMREWGAEYERNLDYARRTAQAFGGDELIERLEHAGIGNDPVVFQALYRIGRELGEDEIFADGSDDDRRARLADRARALRGRRDRWTNTQVDRELREIMAELHGTEPVDPGGA